MVCCLCHASFIPHFLLHGTDLLLSKGLLQVRLTQMNGKTLVRVKAHSQHILAEQQI